MSAYAYQDALREAGATVHRFASFGTYQGDFIAFVTYAGHTGFVIGSFGSCSGCDHIEREMAQLSYNDDYTVRIGERAVLKRIGLELLEDIVSQQEAIKKASENIDWDDDAKRMVDWIREHHDNQEP